MSPGFSADLSPVELIEEYSRMLPSATTTLSHDYDYPPPPGSKQRDWKSYPLRSAYITSLLVLEIATVLTLSILLAISESRNGLLSVQHLLGPDKSPGGMLQNLWSAAYLWTTLPNAFFTLSRDLWASVVDAASKQQPYVELRKGNKNQILLSTERVFEAIYAVANDGLRFPRSVVDNDEPPSIPGILSTLDTRLFVVPETAYYIIVILFFTAVCNVMLHYYHRRHRSVLWEEPVGLLRAAELLYGGNTSRFIARVRAHHPAATRIVKLALNDPAYALYTAAVDERGKLMVSASGRDLDDMMWNYKPASGYSV
ncbi:hypothetical protein BO82DRAFT_403994 [Aspergillus uvarum CBS 121591]|uniref:Uncharacterized protein n=1 Tax=Aspergillus uvarum CBS 121591 TaxID=1448315 RepID=A0A319DJP7_9EURO|nr:hypothetical protein BO82DRAFT_403994 [Aspergillus uvarum CBS 121591]PYH79672.1 hypothetical protein BO82DRAFT_403994 [Aspergillus uvarum CBS 121591]